MSIGYVMEASQEAQILEQSRGRRFGGLQCYGLEAR